MKTAVKLDQLDLVTAILDEIGKQHPKFGMIPRQFNSVIDAANNIRREFEKEEIHSTPGEGIQAWRLTDQVGKSADFMAAEVGQAGIRDYAHPLDPSDFGRCLTLLAAAPELRENLSEMAETSWEWERLVENWEELEGLWKEEESTGKCPKLYARMKELYREVQEE